MNTLCSQLLHSNDSVEKKQPEQSSFLPIIRLLRHHKHVYRKPHGRCQWEKLHPPGYPRKRSSKRKFGTDITESTVNSASEAILSRLRTQYKCSKYQVWLCIEGDCWQRYHHSIGVSC
jgi:hypothetical protein